MTDGIISSILASLPTSSRTDEIDTDVPIHLRAKLSRQTQMAMAKAARKLASRKKIDAATTKRHANRRKRIADCKEINKALYRKYQRFVHDAERRGHGCTMTLEDFVHLWQVVPDVVVKGIATPAIELRRPMTQYPRVSLRQINPDKPFSLDNTKVMLFSCKYARPTCIYPEGCVDGFAIAKAKPRKRRKKIVTRRSKTSITDYIQSMDFSKYR